LALPVDDKVAIHELLARYNRAFDAGAAEEWASTFTKDGTFHSLVDTHVGRIQLIEFARAFTLSDKFGAKHWVNNVIIEGDGDEATLSCYALVVKSQDVGATILRLTSYSDRLRKVDGEWKFVSRTVTSE
jgi:3-phenylpropionate/cinnamic acid dioxygenase small subunit